MAPDPLCPRCNEIESLTHKFIDCGYIKRIWQEVFKHSKSITTSDPSNEDVIEAALGAYENSNIAVLTLNAEILQRITSMQENNYLIHPKFLIKTALLQLVRRERNQQCKLNLESILESLVR